MYLKQYKLDTILRGYCFWMIACKNPIRITNYCKWYQDRCRYHEDEIFENITEFRISKGIARWTSNFSWR
jgi:hypothetical protein